MMRRCITRSLLCGPQRGPQTLASHPRQASSWSAHVMDHVRPHLQHMPQSATLAMNNRCAAMAARGQPVWRFGFGQSPFPVHPSVVERLQAFAHEKDYLPVEGLPQLRRAVAQYYADSMNLHIDHEQVMIGDGSKMLMFLLQAVVQCHVLLPSPSWVSYQPQAATMGNTWAWIPTRDENRLRLMPEDLDRYCLANPHSGLQLLVLNYPSNPTGASYTSAELRELAHVCRKHRLLVLSDEIYGRLTFDERNIDSLYRYYEEGTIISSGMSKAHGAGGWRLGTFVFPKSLESLEQVVAVAGTESISSVAAPIQHAAIAAHQHDLVEPYVAAGRNIMSGFARTIVPLMHRAGINVHAPDGGFYVFPSFAPLRDRLAQRGILTSDQLCERLLEETGVALLSGTHFGSHEADLTARLSYVGFDGGELLRAYAETGANGVDESWIRTHGAHTIEGIERMCAWAMQTTS